MEESCCTCATLLSAVPRHRPAGPESEKSEKQVPLPEHKRLSCCGRIICGSCLDKNSRFASYCPYCQISTGPSSLPPAGLKDPPPYGSVGAAEPPPPPYTSTTGRCRRRPVDDKSKESDEEEKREETDGAGPQPPPPNPNRAEEEDVIHFLDHERDTVASLSLRYGVPAQALRRANRLGSDHLLQGRRVVVIPIAAAAAASASSSSCRAPPTTSLSPRPVEGEEEERRKNRIRRWMVACKEADYDVALLYLEQSAYDLDAAVEAYFADEAWERANPLDRRPGGRGRGGGPGSGSGGGRRRAGIPSSSFSSSSSAAASTRSPGGVALDPDVGSANRAFTWAAQAAFLGRW